MQSSETFRQDLYYRLKSHHIAIPPLRDRKKDLPFLIDHFIAKGSITLNKKRPTPPKELYTLLSNYQFPGNVRELEGMMFDAISLHTSGVLSLESIRAKIAEHNHDRALTNGSSVQPQGSQQTANELLSFPGRFPTLKEAEDSLVDEALRRAEGNQTIAAELLGISRRALNNRLRRTDEKKS
jgi:transcriptional regulator with PAS, ATPase and Fis domain